MQCITSYAVVNAGSSVLRGIAEAVLLSGPYMHQVSTHISMANNFGTICSAHYSVTEEKDTCLCPISFDFIMYDIIKHVHQDQIKLTSESVPNYFFPSAKYRTIS